MRFSQSTHKHSDILNLKIFSLLNSIKEVHYQIWDILVFLRNTPISKKKFNEIIFFYPLRARKLGMSKFHQEQHTYNDELCQRFVTLYILSPKFELCPLFPYSCNLNPYSSPTHQIHSCSLNPTTTQPTTHKCHLPIYTRSVLAQTKSD